MPLPLLPLAGAGVGLGLSYLMPDYRKQFYEMLGLPGMASGESMLRGMAPDNAFFGTRQAMPNLTMLGQTNPIAAMAGAMPQPDLQEDLSGWGKGASFLLDALTDPLMIAGGVGAKFGRAGASSIGRALGREIPQAAESGLLSAAPDLGNKIAKMGVSGADELAGAFLPGQRPVRDMLMAPWKPTIDKAAEMVGGVNSAIGAGVEGASGLANRTASAVKGMWPPMQNLAQARPIQRELGNISELEGMIQSRLTGPPAPAGPTSMPGSAYRPEYLAEFPEAVGRRGRLQLPPDPITYGRVTPEASALAKELGLGQTTPSGLQVMQKPSILQGRGGVMDVHPSAPIHDPHFDPLDLMMTGMPKQSGLPSTLSEAIGPSEALAMQKKMPWATSTQWKATPTGMAEVPGPHMVDLSAETAMPFLDLMKQQRIGQVQDLQGKYGLLERIAASGEPGQSPLAGLLGGRRGFTVMKDINPEMPAGLAGGLARTTGASLPSEAVGHFVRSVFPELAAGNVGGKYSGGVKTAFLPTGATPGVARHEMTHGLVDAARSGATGLPLPIRTVAAMETSPSPILKAMGLIGDETLGHAYAGRGGFNQLRNALDFLIAPHPGYYGDVAEISPLVSKAWKYGPLAAGTGALGAAGLGTGYAISR